MKCISPRWNSFDSFTDVIMHWLIVNEYLCHRWPRIYFICGSQSYFSFWLLCCPFFSSNYGFWLFSVFYLNKMASFITHVENNKRNNFSPKKIKVYLKKKMKVYLKWPRVWIKHISLAALVLFVLKTIPDSFSVFFC